MGTCLLCTSPRSIGLLCTAHGVAIAAPGITSEQIFSRLTTGVGSLVDSWGCAHAVADGTRISRDQRVDGGVLRIGESSIELAAMEFGLLQLLVERRRIVTDIELAYVAWHEIADALAFKSVQADSENVRELVHRVRRKLGTVQADDLIESKRGVGYRLAGEPG